jgi:hypothetical protein
MVLAEVGGRAVPMRLAFRPLLDARGRFEGYAGTLSTFVLDRRALQPFRPRDDVDTGPQAVIGADTIAARSSAERRRAIGASPWSPS